MKVVNLTAMVVVELSRFSSELKPRFSRYQIYIAEISFGEE